MEVEDVGPGAGDVLARTSMNSAVLLPELHRSRDTTKVALVRHGLVRTSICTSGSRTDRNGARATAQSQADVIADRLRTRHVAEIQGSLH